jgi:hypothetical protein
MQKSHHLTKQTAILLVVLYMPWPGIEDHSYMKKEYANYEKDS